MIIEDITKIMAIIATEYDPLFIVTEERIGIWHKVLGHATYGEALRAVEIYFSEDHDYPPRIGKLNRKIIAVRYQEKRRAELNRPALPEMSEEQRQKNKAFFKQVYEDLANKKAMRV